jgi:hypothetical protein
VSEGTSYLRVLDRLVEDMAGNPIAGVLADQARGVELYVADSTPPALLSCRLDLRNNSVFLEFSERVVSLPWDSVNVSLRSGLQLCSLRRSNALASVSAYVVVPLHRDDLDCFHRSRDLVSSNESLICSIGAGEVADLASVLNLAGASPVAIVLQDIIRPELLSFSLDLSNEQLEMTFSELVDPLSFYAGGIFLTHGVLSVSLRTSRLLSEVPSASFLVQLDGNDLNVLKATYPLCSNASICSLNFSEVVRDMNGNSLVDGVLGPNIFHPDTVSPTLRGFDLDLNASRLVLRFSETVRASSIALGGLLMSGGASGVRVRLGGEGSRLESDDEYDSDVVVALGRQDLNNMKRTSGLATSAATSRLHFDAFVSDVFGNRIAAVGLNASLAAEAYTADATSPVLLQWGVDLNSGWISMEFDEVVLPQSFVVARLQLAGLGNASRGLSLFSVQPLGNNASENFTLQLSPQDLHRIKLAPFFTARGNSFLVVSAGMITDRAGNLARATVQLASVFVGDSTQPRLVAVGADLNASRLEMLFDEPIRANSVRLEQLRLLGSPEVVGAGFALNDSIVLSGDGLRVIVALGTGDVRRMQLDEDLFVSLSSSYVRLLSSFAEDIAGNAVIEEAAVLVSNFTDDHVRPGLVSFSLNMSARVLVMTFSEVMNASTWDSRSLLFSDAQNGLGEHHQLNSSRVLTVADGPVATVSLHQRDFNELAVRRICLVAPLCWLSLQDATFTDQRGLVVLPLVEEHGMMPAEFFVDTVAPALLEFSLNMDAGFMRLSFSEAMLANSFQASAIVLQNLRDVSSGGTWEQVQVSENASVVNADGDILVVYLTTDDLNAIKLRRGLATNISSSFVALAGGSGSDVSGNPSVARQAVDAAPCNEFLGDAQAPRLVGVALDLDSSYINESTALRVGSAVLELVFSEVVDVSSLTTNRITLSYQGNRVSLAGMQTLLSAGNGLSAKLRLFNADVNRIKAYIAGPVAAGHFLLDLGSGTVLDMAGNAVGDTVAAPLDQLVADQTEPNLLSFSLDLNAGRLVLTFDEIVEGRSLEPVELSLVDGAVRDDANTTLHGALADNGTPWEPTLDRNGFVHANGPVVSFTLLKTDLEEIKRLDLCTRQNDCFLVHSEWLIRDVSGNQIVGCV